MKIEKPTKTVLLSKVFHAIPEARLPEIFDAIPRMAGTGIETIGGLQAILEDGSQRYLQAMAGKSTYHPFLGFLDIALIIRGLTRALEPTFEFLRVLKAANPRLSAWPIWQVTDTRADEAEQPHFLNDRFEAYLYYPYSSAQRRRGTLDFMIFDPRGRFFFDEHSKTIWGRPDESRATRTLEIYLQARQMAEALPCRQKLCSNAWLRTGNNLKFLLPLVRNKKQKNRSLQKRTEKRSLSFELR